MSYPPMLSSSVRCPMACEAGQGTGLGEGERILLRDLSGLQGGRGSKGGHKIMHRNCMERVNVQNLIAKQWKAGEILGGKEISF